MPDLVNPLDIRSVGGAGKDSVLQCIHLTFEFLQNRKIFVDDEIYDRINDEALAHRQHLRRALAARAHLLVSRVRTVPHGDHVAAAGEDMSLAAPNLAILQRGRAHHDE